MIKLHLRRSTIFSILDILKFFLILILLLMFVNFNARIARQSDETQELTKSTNKVVKGQADLLVAIKKVTTDTGITAAQQTAIIICMLQVPVESRTTDLQTQCRKQALSVDEDRNVGTSGSSAGSSSSSSSQSTPSKTPQQSNNSQKPADETPPPKPVQTCTLDAQVLFLPIKLGCTSSTA